jgi:hypothetical protein
MLDTLRNALRGCPRPMRSCCCHPFTDEGTEAEKGPRAPKITQHEAQLGVKTAPWGGSLPLAAMCPGSFHLWMDSLCTLPSPDL